MRCANDYRELLSQICTMPNVTRIHERKQPRRPHFIREWMEMKGLRAKDLAEELDVDKSVVSRWLAGATPTEENQQILADFFGCERDGIFRHPDDDWMARFLRDRPPEEVKKIKRVMSELFPRQAG